MNDKCMMCGGELGCDGAYCGSCAEEEPNFNTIKVRVSLSTPKDISEFVRLASMCSEDVVLRSGHYAVNAKSLMGVYSLNLSKPVMVEFYGSIPNDIKDGIKKYMLR